MARAVARYLAGKDFAALGQSKLLQFPVGFANLLPPKMRKSVFARFGAAEGISPEEAGRVNSATIADWITDLYPKRRYPVIIIGSASGALVHLAAALDAPWLPQTMLTLIKQRGVGIDEPVCAMDAGRPPAELFLAANPDVQLHHMHDPSQDRLMLAYITYFRWKYRRLPQAYRNFIDSSLEPNGTIVIAECEQSWPTTQVGDRHVFQFGAVGGPTVDEYFSGGERVANYLARCGSHLRKWHPAAPDRESPEAEWGFEPSLRESVETFARERNYRLVRLRFDEPDDLSPAIADFYREWYRERGIASNRLLIESFIQLEPYWTLRTASVPFWMKFNMRPSLERAAKYVAEAGPFDHIRLILFAHGVNSIGLPSIAEWREILAQARLEGSFLGVEENAYPAHFAGFSRYYTELRSSPERHPLPKPIGLDRFERFLKSAEGSYRVSLSWARQAPSGRV